MSQLKALEYKEKFSEQEYIHQIKKINIEIKGKNIDLGNMDFEKKNLWGMRVEMKGR